MDDLLDVEKKLLLIALGRNRADYPNPEAIDVIAGKIIASTEDRSGDMYEMAQGSPLSSRSQLIDRLVSGAVQEPRTPYKFDHVRTMIQRAAYRQNLDLFFAGRLDGSSPMGPRLRNMIAAFGSYGDDGRGTGIQREFFDATGIPPAFARWQFAEDFPKEVQGETWWWVEVVDPVAGEKLTEFVACVKQPNTTAFAVTFEWNGPGGLEDFTGPAHLAALIADAEQDEYESQVYLTGWKATDADDFERLMTTANVAEWLGGEDELPATGPMMSEDADGYWSIAAKIVYRPEGDPVFAGAMWARGVDDPDGEGYPLLTIAVDAEHQGKGIAARAIRHAAYRMRQSSGIPRLQFAAKVHRNNANSIKMLEALGAEFRPDDGDEGYLHATGFPPIPDHAQEG